MSLCRQPRLDVGDRQSRASGRDHIGTETQLAQHGLRLRGRTIGSACGAAGSRCRRLFGDALGGDLAEPEQHRTDARCLSRSMEYLQHIAVALHRHVEHRLVRLHGADDLAAGNEIALADADVVKRLASRMICTDCGVNRQDDVEFATCYACGGPLVPRSDDREQVVRTRLDVYRRQTAPLVSYYQARPTFCRVNGAQLFDYVAADLVRAVQRAAGLERS